MAEGKGVAVVPLNSSNYATWKVQCRMALIKDGLWDIVSGTETAPDVAADGYAKFVARRDCALAVIVLSIEPSLLYLIGDPQDPVAVWTKLRNQFQKSTSANKLSLRRKLYGLKLKDNDSVHDHIKSMTEIFDELSVIGDAISEEDRVVYLLASLPDSFNILVTALEANPEVPKMELVTERLLHEERKTKERGGGTGESCDGAAMVVKSQKRRGLRCHNCHRLGHIQRNCPDRSRTEHERKPVISSYREKRNTPRQRINQVSVNNGESSSSDSNNMIGLVVRHALSVGGGSEKTGSWIIDSGATCHICNDASLFVSLRELNKSLEVVLGDGHLLSASKQGDVELMIESREGRNRKCVLRDVLFVPSLAYNLLSVSKATENGNTITFDDEECRIYDYRKRPLAEATKSGKLYHLKFQVGKDRQVQEIHATDVGGREELWHRRFGHLGISGLRQLAKGDLVEGLDFDCLKELEICESCIEGKQHRAPFPHSSRRTKNPLELVHSDVCGKLSECSLGGARYFLTFIDDCSRYIWVYMLKHKSEVFSRFKEWKALVETSTGRKLQAIRTDNGGEYLSTEFQNYLKTEGVKHERTIPKTPQQNGVAERMNRTLVETTRSMMSDAKLPKRFWAEALSTAVYLRNRCLTKAVMEKTPYQAFTGEKPSVSHLRVFGCVAYAHVPSDERHKLDSKSRRCIFLGYSTEVKGYRLYDQKKSRVFFSRDVIFDESKVGIESEATERQVVSPKVEIECDTDILDAGNTTESVTDSGDNVSAPSTEQEEGEPPEPRRSNRTRRQPDYYGVWVNATEEQPVEPGTLEEALSSSEKEKWEDAMQKELESLENNDVLDLVDLPEGRRVVGSRWVFKRKVGSNGIVERYKARLVARGYSQKFGEDYDETFSPLVRFESIRMIVSLAAHHRLQLHQMDVTTAFLNGELEEEVFMKQPEGFVKRGQEQKVCKLKRSIYGLRQSPRCWNFALDSQLKKMGFQQTTSDPCLYISTEGELFIVAVYVDDILLAGKSTKRMEEVKKEFGKQFKV